MDKIAKIQQYARSKNDTTRPKWPMIILRTPKGWTGPKVVDGHKIEGNFRSHQVPLPVDESHPENVAKLEKWLKSYRPNELFDKNGQLIPELQEMSPNGNKRMGANKHANGGSLLRELHMPDFRDYELKLSSPGGVMASNTAVTGTFLRDIIKLNHEQSNFRIFGPDETVSNKLDAVFEATNRQWDADTEKTDEFLAPQGMVHDSMLSEHQCQGWLEGYLLTGRHGLFHSYEAFIRIVDSMLNQHAKWIKMSSEISWRDPIASLNYLLTSHVWRQDHNGFTHQDPGFIDHLINKKAETTRIYLPPDANTLLSVMDHILQSRNYINLVICDKHDSRQWLTMEQAIEHCSRGISRWEWASNDDDGDPDVVIASAGDVPTLETLAAVSILRDRLPKLKIRYVNVVDLMMLEDGADHPHGLSSLEFDELFTKDKLVVFAFHGYPWLIHRLTYKRANKKLHVRGYIEEGTITTAFDMTVMNKMDRFNLVIDVVDRLELGDAGQVLKVDMQKRLLEHKNYIEQNGIDMPEIENWRWNF